MKSSPIAAHLLVAGGFTSPEQTVNDWLSSLYAAGRATATIAGYSKSARYWLAWAAEAGVPGDWEGVTADHLRGWLASLRARGLKPNSMVSHERNLRALWTWLMEQDEVRENPWQRIRRLQAEEPLVTPPSPADVQAMLDVGIRRARETHHWQAYRDVALLAVLYDTGLRAAELLSLRVGALDEDAVHVMGKGRTPRLVALSPNVRTALRRYLRAYARAMRELGPADALWQGRQGPLSYGRLHQIIQAAGRAVGIELHPHLLRHGFGTWALEEGADESAVMTLLGHTNPRITARYTKSRRTQRAIRAHQEYSPARRLKLS